MVHLPFSMRGHSRWPASRLLLSFFFFFFLTTNLFFRSTEMSVWNCPWDAEMKPPPLPASYLILCPFERSLILFLITGSLFQEAGPPSHHSYYSPYFISGSEAGILHQNKTKKTNQKKVKVYHLQWIRFAGSPCRKEASADMEDGLPSFVWTTRKPPASSIHHSVSQRGASDPAWHPPCRRLHCQFPSILPSISAMFFQILLYFCSANNTQLCFQE